MATLSDMKNIVLVVLLGLLICSSAMAQELAESKALHTYATGYGGRKSPTYLLFEKELLRGEEARSVFQDCLEKGTPAGRLYGALGLYHLDRDIGKKAFRRLLKDESEVSFLQGCLLHKTSVNSLAENLLSSDPNTLSVRMFGVKTGP